MQQRILNPGYMKFRLARQLLFNSPIETQIRLYISA